MIINTIMMSNVDACGPKNPTMRLISQAAAPLLSNAAPSESAPPKNIMRPQSTPSCASFQSITLNANINTAPINATEKLSSPVWPMVTHNPMVNKSMTMVSFSFLLIGPKDAFLAAMVSIPPTTPLISDL